MRAGGTGSAPQRWRFEIRTRHVAVAFAVGLTIFLHVDVSRRARIVTGQPHLHQTDFTVFTEAGAAFFDGRDPYAVTNPRGWFYLYPPLFALMVAPLSKLDAIAQVQAWYVISVAIGFGCFVEARRIWRIAGECGETRVMPSSHSAWIGACAGLTVLLPTMECLQRGQVGLALLYALLLGFRLVVDGRRWTSVFLGGVVLSWAVVVKLIPALPVGFLLWQRWVFVVSARGTRPELVRASTLSMGVLAGGILFVLAIPAASVGWSANLRHLHTWTRKVVTNGDPGLESKFHIDSATNQSFANAAHLLAARLRRAEPDDPALIGLRFAKNPDQLRWARDTATANIRRADAMTGGVVRIAKALILFALLAVAFVPRSDDRAGQAAVFGLACLAMLLVSPVAWSHYYMMMLPAVLFVPQWLARDGRAAAARWLAVVPVVLVLSHYLAKRWVGDFGLLGLGTTAWFLASCVLTPWIRSARGKGRAGGMVTWSDAEIGSALKSDRLDADSLR